MQARQLLVSLAVAFALTSCAALKSTSNFMDSDGYTVNVAKPGAQQNPLIRRVVWQQRFKNVLIVSKEEGAPANNHPAQLTPEDIAKLLKQIKVINKSKEKIDLFGDAEAKELAPHLAAALGAAGADEEIVFMQSQRRGLLIFDEAVMVSARVFMQGNTLQMIFGTMLVPFEGQWELGGVLKIFQPGSRAKNTATSYKLLGSANGAVTVESERSDWIRIDVAKALQDNVPGQRTIQPVPTPTRSAEERLQKLKELKDKGLIGDEEYNEKRKQILDSL